MIRDDLKQLQHLNREINLLQDQIEQMPVEVDSVSSSQDEFPYCQQNVAITGYSNERYKRIRTRLERKKEECLAKVDELTAFISTVDDSLIRQLLLLRYVQGRKWCQIAAVMGSNYSEDQLKKRLERFFEKN